MTIKTPALAFLASLILTPAAFGKARHAKPLPDPWTLIEKSVSGSPVPYRGKLLVTLFKSSSPETSETIVSFAPPDLYRREVVGTDGKVRGIAISNGKREWVYDKIKRKYWEMTAPSKPDPSRELQKLRANYQALLIGMGHAAGRRAVKVELRSQKNGKPSRVMWLDPKYGVLLKSQAFDKKGKLVLETVFNKIRFFIKKPANPEWFSFHPPAKAKPAQEEIAASLKQVKIETRLNPLVPSWLPFGYALEKVQPLSNKGRSIIQEEFSDGINAISLFEYSGSAPLKEGGPAEEIALSSGTGLLRRTSEGMVLSWSRQGLLLVLVAPLDRENLTRIANSIP